MSRLERIGVFLGYSGDEIDRARGHADGVDAERGDRNRGVRWLRSLVDQWRGVESDPTLQRIADAIARFARVEVDAPGESDRPLLLYIVCDQRRIPSRERDTASLLALLSAVVPFRLVCIEGGEGVVDAGWLKSFPFADTRREVSGGMLDQGQLTGEEYFLLASEHVFLLYGVDSLHFRALLDSPGRWKWEELNRARSRVMLKRCVEKMEDLGESVGILITTSFHYFELVSLVREIGLGMVTFWPRGTGDPVDLEIGRELVPPG